jgi:4-hydroxybenzoate polyprenyltransferase
MPATSNAPTVSQPGLSKTWLQLFRAPNLFTVPGDPIAGYLISNSGFADSSLALVAGASICFYAAGLLLNDLVDLAEDKLERPSRPLPAGHASLSTVRRVHWLLNLLGLLLLIATGSTRAVIAGISTVLAVWSYNCLTKKIPVVGALNMGLCRALSMLIGALAGPSPFMLPVAALMAISSGLFIAAVTNLARFETQKTLAVAPRFLPVLALLPGLAIGIQNALYSPDKVPAAILFGVTLAGGLNLLRLLLARPFPLPPLIGAHIRLLLPFQAAACWFGASQSFGPAFAVSLLSLWPVSRVVSKRFYAS